MPEPQPGALPFAPSRHPLIGITAGRKVLETGVGELAHFVQPVFYAEAVSAVDGIPVVLPAAEDRLEDLLSRLDGLILTGGGDIDPRCYGQPAHPITDKVEPTRDEFELGLARFALRTGIPILGVCRGAQVINVAAGGSLIQDIPSQRGDEIAHMQSSLARPAHSISIDADSRVARSLGVTSIDVNSGHHQAVLELGAGMRAVAWAKDGIVEAIESDQHPWAMGVQWHPEMLWRERLAHRGLFGALVEAARRGIDAGERSR